MADLIDRDALLEEAEIAPMYAVDAMICYDLIKSEPSVNRCISVKDALPDTDGEYLVYTDHYEIVEYSAELQQFGHTDEYKDELGYNIVEWYDVRNVTHWMYLPEPPKDKLK